MPTKPPLLFLVHRIPYPPDKGDKIRSYHLLKSLSDRFDVYLGSFVDDAEDWKFCKKVESLCAGAYFVRRSKILNRLTSVPSLLGSTPLSLAFYHSRDMARWVETVVQRFQIKTALVFCAPMAQFVQPGTSANRLLERIVIDFVDVDSLKWRQYAEGRVGITRWVYSREASTLFAYERKIATTSHRSFFVSEEEADIFRELAPECSATVCSFRNGVDTNYFNAERGYENPYNSRTNSLVFTGAMDYWPNVDAVSWFVEEVFAKLRVRYKNAQFWIVGSKPTSEVLALAKREGVVVTGRVQDVRHS